MNGRCFGLMTAFAVAASLLVTGFAKAQNGYPNRPIRWVVPATPGGPLDGSARKLAEIVAKRLGQPIVIENRAGASGSIGAAEVAKSAPDGYTFLFSQAESLINVVSLVKNLSYDPKKDFALITQAVTVPAVIITNPSVPGQTLDDVLKQGKQKGVPLIYGSWGPGTFPHILFEKLASRSGVAMTHVPYRGGLPAMQDLIGKQIDLTVTAPSLAAQFAERGQARPLAISGERRSSLLPDVPTLTELGYREPVFLMTIWLGLSAPAGTKPEIVDRMFSEVKTALATPELESYFRTSGSDIMATSPADFRKAFDQEFAQVGEMIRNAGVIPE